MSEQLLILLPPSETKTDGGNSPFPPDRRWPELDPIRESLAEDLIALSSGDPGRAATALKISAKQAERELARNRELASPRHRPAVERYTGVLYDALDATSLAPPARAWLHGHVAIHSALYGLVGAGEGIAAYRLSHNSRPGGESLKARWRTAVAAALRDHEGPVLDLRSKGYVELGPLDGSARRAWANVAERGPDGSLKSLNHFNKQSKGALVRMLANRLAGAGEPAGLQELAEALAPEFELETVEDGLVNIVRNPSEA
ncbi:YaaA family protein [Gulosibacter sp. 10]|uniref:YaaA family protein n=1 Tax=Gulosibacter sp. 10 TaxID=1255570 RepID=UPI00097F298C|nr:peroxide stress protein YaaA [Gulosibacter sp. 10]SJM57759.1 UPF0246 protein YaaA [Gulosibacter sp. 10]